VQAFLTTIAEHGTAGLAIAVLIYWLREKDKELKEERAARIKDAKDYTDLALKLQSEVVAAVHKLTAVFEEIKRTIGPNRDRRG
jgi:hypothetical protein